MSFEFILYEKKGRVAYVTMNRPDSLNALHPMASSEMLEAFTDFRDGPGVLAQHRQRRAAVARQ